MRSVNRDKLDKFIVTLGLSIGIFALLFAPIGFYLASEGVYNAYLILDAIVFIEMAVLIYICVMTLFDIWSGCNE